MNESDWRVEAYRGMDVYVLLSQRRESGVAGNVGNLGDGGRWRYEVRICQEGADPADAGDTELLTSGVQTFPTRHAAEVAAFGAGYALVDKIVGPVV